MEAARRPMCLSEIGRTRRHVLRCALPIGHDGGHALSYEVPASEQPREPMRFRAARPLRDGEPVDVLSDEAFADLDLAIFR